MGGASQEQEVTLGDRLTCPPSGLSPPWQRQRTSLPEPSPRTSVRGSALTHGAGRTTAVLPTPVDHHGTPARNGDRRRFNEPQDVPDHHIRHPRQHTHPVARHRTRRCLAPCDRPPHRRPRPRAVRSPPAPLTPPRRPGGVGRGPRHRPSRTPPHHTHHPQLLLRRAGRMPPVRRRRRGGPLRRLDGLRQRPDRRVRTLLRHRSAGGRQRGRSGRRREHAGLLGDPAVLDGQSTRCDRPRGSGPDHGTADRFRTDDRHAPRPRLPGPCPCRRRPRLRPVGGRHPRRLRPRGPHRRRSAVRVLVQPGDGPPAARQFRARPGRPAPGPPALPARLRGPRHGG